ncbi:MAG: 8-oxo-dGTP diphosphatase MutT [bacterium]
MQVVTAAVIEKEGKILVAKRRRGDHLENKWEFPGGKLEQGETPEQCLRRELLEEFGIETRIGEFICSSQCVYSHISIELLAYRAEHLSGAITLYEHEEIRWVWPEELEAYDFANADIPIVKKLMQDYAEEKRSAP